MKRAQKRTQVFAGIALAAVLLQPSGCSNASGRVVDRYETVNPVLLHLTVKSANGKRHHVTVHGHAWRHCHVGDFYPDCANS